MSSRLEAIPREWDLIVIGGGITGAGIHLEASRMGLRSLLVEQRDFAWGTSSRSSKLVHGGLRYLAQGHLGLTREAILERKRLLEESAGLVEHLDFLTPIYRGSSPSRTTLKIGLSMYDGLAGQWDHRWQRPSAVLTQTPGLIDRGLYGAYRYGDAQTDDARLVWRILDEAETHGGVAFNYARVEGIEFGSSHKAVTVLDCHDDQDFEFHSPMVVNATGVWANRLKRRQERLRPLRGSHLVLPHWRLPVYQAVTLFHPEDRRPVFLIPWEGATLFGTTDLDHHDPLNEEARMTAEERRYLLAALNHFFPDLELTNQDILSSYAGVRPVISSGNGKSPSQESRDHEIWDENGLLTITGGKLTTFRRMAIDLLRHGKSYLPHFQLSKGPIFAPIEPVDTLGTPPDMVRRVTARYGRHARSILSEVTMSNRAPWDALVPGTSVAWEALAWSARHEQVHRLEDLLLRRTRLGNLLPDGGLHLAQQLKQVCAEGLGWSSQRWDDEWQAYQRRWRSCYAPVTELQQEPQHVASPGHR